VNRDGTGLRLTAGDTVWTPPGEEHWHGGAAATFMCNVAMLEGVEDDDGTTWLEPVSDEAYEHANQIAQQG
jgi:quercetin dioxygenase-like cupin family protein